MTEFALCAVGFQPTTGLCRCPGIALAVAFRVIRKHPNLCCRLRRRSSCAVSLARTRRGHTSDHTKIPGTGGRLLAAPAYLPRSRSLWFFLSVPSFSFGSHLVTSGNFDSYEMDEGGLLTRTHTSHTHTNSSYDLNFDY